MSNTKENSSGEEYTIDSDVKEELENVVSEEQIIGTYTSDAQNGQKEQVVSNWFPDSAEWQGKTVVNAREARVLSMARNLPKAFEEIEHMEPFIDELISDLEKYLTSVDGISREQQKSVLMALFGESQTDDAARNMVLGALAGDTDD